MAAGSRSGRWSSRLSHQNRPHKRLEPGREGYAQPRASRFLCPTGGDIGEDRGIGGAVLVAGTERELVMVQHDRRLIRESVECMQAFFEGVPIPAEVLRKVAGVHKPVEELLSMPKSTRNDQIAGIWKGRFQRRVDEIQARVRSWSHAAVRLV